MLKRVIIVAICAGYAVICLIRLPAAPLIEPDSAEYLRFAPVRSLGYPVFLKILGPNAAIVAQPVLYATALAALGLETMATTSSLVPAAAVVAASMFVPDLFEYHVSILTESLFMSGLTLYLAAMIRFVRSPSPLTAAFASGIAGATATVRSTGYAFLAVLLVMVLIQWRRLLAPRAVVLAAAALPIVVISGSERLAARAIHGENLTTLFGRHLFAKAGMIDAPAAQPSFDPLRARLDTILAVEYGPIRRLIDAAPDNIRVTLTLYYEGCLQARCVERLRDSIGMPDARVDDAMAGAGLSRIFRAPLNFARLTATHYRSFWMVYKLRHPDRVRALNGFIASHRPLPFEREAFALEAADTLEFQPSERVRYMEPAVILIGWFTGGLAMAGLAAAATRRPLPPAFAVACLASLTAHGGLLFSALLAAGISRFMIAMWPATMTAVLFGGWYLAGRQPRSRQSPPGVNTSADLST
jgi:hypothetical protein